MATTYTYLVADRHGVESTTRGEWTPDEYQAQLDASGNGSRLIATALSGGHPYVPYRPAGSFNLGTLALIGGVIYLLFRR
jgi:hypothetical protein